MMITLIIWIYLYSGKKGLLPISYWNSHFSISYIKNPCISDSIALYLSWVVVQRSVIISRCNFFKISVLTEKCRTFKLKNISNNQNRQVIIEQWILLKWGLKNNRDAVFRNEIVWSIYDNWVNVQEDFIEEVLNRNKFLLDYRQSLKVFGRKAGSKFVTIPKYFSNGNLPIFFSCDSVSFIQI